MDTHTAMTVEKDHIVQEESPGLQSFLKGMQESLNK